MVEPFPRTKFVPDNALTVPAVPINVPAREPITSVGAVTVPVNVGDAANEVAKEPVPEPVTTPVNVMVGAVVR